MVGYFSKPGSVDTSTSGVGGASAGQRITKTIVTLPQFILNPGQYNTNIYIRYTSVTGIKIFKYAPENIINL